MHFLPLNNNRESSIFFFRSFRKVLSPFLLSWWKLSIFYNVCTIFIENYGDLFIRRTFPIRIKLRKSRSSAKSKSKFQRDTRNRKKVCYLFPKRRNKKNKNRSQTENRSGNVLKGVYSFLIVPRLLGLTVAQEEYSASSPTIKKKKRLIVKLIVIDLPAEAPVLYSIFSMSGIEFLIKLLSASLLIRDVFPD